MISQLKIVELRERAREVLGDRFSVREFHPRIRSDEFLTLPVIVAPGKLTNWAALEGAVGDRFTRKTTRLIPTVPNTGGPVTIQNKHVMFTFAIV